MLDMVWWGGNHFRNYLCLFMRNLTTLIVEICQFYAMIFLTILFIEEVIYEI